eukprot:547316-Hanusia_phi.AAC.2
MSKLKIGGVYGDKEFCPQRSISRAASHQLILVSTNCEDDPGSPPPYVHLKDKKTNRSQSFQVKDVKPPAQGASALDGRMRRRSSQGKVPIFLRAQSSDSLLVKKGPREQRQPISRAQSSQNSFRRKEITQTRAPRPASKIRAREVREEAQEEAPAAERHAAPLQRKQQGSFHLLNSQLQALAGERTRSMAHLRDLQKDLEELRKTTGAENAAEVELVDPDEETEQAPPPPRVPKVVCDLRRAVQKSSYLLQQVAKLKMNASTAQGDHVGPLFMLARFSPSSFLLPAFASPPLPPPACTRATLHLTPLRCGHFPLSIFPST